MSILKTYRCPKCDDILFKGKLTKGTIIIKMCKNKNIKNEDGKYRKCKTMVTLKGDENGNI